MREIRMLRAMWRGLETELRTTLPGHEGGNPGYRPGKSYGSPRQSSTLPEGYRDACRKAGIKCSWGRLLISLERAE